MIFKSGISNLSELHGEVVVRINKDSHKRFINREVEPIVLELMKNYTFPVISYNELELKTKFTQLFEFNFLDEIENIVFLISYLHKFKIDYVFDPFKIIEESNIKLDFDKDRISKLKSIWEKRDKVLCHNDLLLSNFGKTETSFIIYDFEYAGMNDPLFDIASLITENNLYEHEDKIINLFGIDDKKLLHEYYYLNDVLWTIWGYETNNENLIKDKEKRIKY